MSKILVLSYLPIHPANDGGRARIHEFAANLSKEHEVAVVCPRLSERPSTPPPYKLRDIGGVGARRQLFDPGLLIRLLRLVDDTKPDVLLLEYVWQGFHAALVRTLRGCLSCLTRSMWSRSASSAPAIRFGQPSASTSV